MIRILHIDDDANDRELAEFRLKRLLQDPHIVGKGSGAAALELLESENFDCILCDYQMPGMNGLEVLREVRSRFDGIPFIFVTGQGNEEIAAEALRSGADDYFTKGEGMLHYERLVNSLRHHIDIHTLKQRQQVNQERIEHLNLVLQASRSVNRIITKATEAGPMLEQACTKLVKARGYKYGWIALFNDTGDITKWIVETVNGDSNFLKRYLETGAQSSEIELASRSDRVVTVKDCKCVGEERNDWCQGSCNFMLKQLMHSGTALGVICVALPNDSDIEHEETQLFSELADDLALALGKFEEAEKRQRAEEALKQTKANLNSIIAAAPGAIGVVVDRCFVWVNQRMEQMLGYSAEELIGKSARILYESEEEYQQVGESKYGQIARSGIGSVVTQWVRKDGSLIDIFLQSAPINPYDLSEGVTFVGTDISETVSMQRQLRESERLLHSLNREARIAS